MYYVEKAQILPAEFKRWVIFRIPQVKFELFQSCGLMCKWTLPRARQHMYHVSFEFDREKHVYL